MNYLDIIFKIGIFDDPVGIVLCKRAVLVYKQTVFKLPQRTVFKILAVKHGKILLFVDVLISYYAQLEVIIQDVVYGIHRVSFFEVYRYLLVGVKQTDKVRKRLCDIGRSRNGYAEAYTVVYLRLIQRYHFVKLFEYGSCIA